MLSLMNAFGAGLGLGFIYRTPDLSKDPICRRHKLLEKALSSKAIQYLYEKACSTSSYNPISNKYETGHWNVGFVEKTSSGFRAECDHKVRTIKLTQASTDDEALSIWVLELTNAIQYERFCEICAKIHQIGCETFVKEMEHIEHDGVCLQRKVMNEAINEMGWGKKLDNYSKIEPDFEKEWIKRKDTPHAQYWRQYWRKLNPGKSEPEIRNGCSKAIQKISRFFIEGICTLIS